MRLKKSEEGVRVKLRGTDRIVRAGGAGTGLSQPRVPIQEPTGKFALAAPHAKPARRRTAKPSRVRKLFAWLWRNAEPLAWGAALGTLGFSLWFSPRTQLTRVAVQGVPTEARASVEQTLRDHLRPPMPLTDAPRQIERALRQQPWIETARWRAVGIGQAQLQVQSRAPFVLIQNANGDRIFTDPTGFLFLPPNQNSKPLSGRIRLGQGYPTLQQGRFLDGEMRRAFTILQAIHPRADVRHPRALVSKTQGIRLWLELQRRGTASPFPLQVRFGDANALNAQLQTLTRILDTPTYNLQRWEYIDISAPSAEVVKPRTTPVGGEP